VPRRWQAFLNGARCCKSTKDILPKCITSDASCCTGEAAGNGTASDCPFGTKCYGVAPHKLEVDISMNEQKREVGYQWTQGTLIFRTTSPPKPFHKLVITFPKEFDISRATSTGIEFTVLLDGSPKKYTQGQLKSVVTSQQLTIELPEGGSPAGDITQLDIQGVKNPNHAISPTPGFKLFFATIGENDAVIQSTEFASDLLIARGALIDVKATFSNEKVRQRNENPENNALTIDFKIAHALPRDGIIEIQGLRMGAFSGLEIVRGIDGTLLALVGIHRDATDRVRIQLRGVALEANSEILVELRGHILTPIKAGVGRVMITTFGSDGENAVDTGVATFPFVERPRLTVRVRNCCGGGV